MFAGRSTRSLVARGAIPREPVLGAGALGALLALVEAPVLLLQSGCWLERALPRVIPPSGTGRPLIGYGKTSSDPAWAFGEETDTLEVQLHGSVLAGAAIPTPRALYLEPAAARQLGALLADGPWDEAIHKLISNEAEFRPVRLPELANSHDRRLRVLQAVTTIQIGGAERVALDLAEGLGKLGHSTWVAALGKPTRKAYPPPRGFFDLSAVPRDPEARAAALAALARRLSADVIQAHLLSAAECTALRDYGIPVAVTMHNMPQAWPNGFADAVAAGVGDGLIAVSRTVADAVRTAFPAVPCWTAWNGISAGRCAPTPDRQAAGRRWREDRGWGEGDLVIVSVANPRLQKRLHFIPEIVAAVRRALPGRQVRCVLAGEPARRNADATEAVALMEESIARCLPDAAESLVRTGASDEIDVLLSAGDVYLSVSAFEGLSLAQLEALAAGLPVVAAAVGGASEIEAEMGEHGKYYRLLPPESSADAFAAAIVEAVGTEGALRCSRLPKAFHRESMARRTEQILTALLARTIRVRKPAEGLWLVTNNFSMGGAQTSARRLLEGLRARGIRVRAFTVQEDEPTRGARILEEAGIPVTAIPPAPRLEPARAAAAIAVEDAAAPPQAVLFWNLIASYKVLLADALGGPGGARLFDVSPGEMNFHSLEAYFAKPRAELPFRSGRDYGAALTGAVVKFAREQERAEAVLGTPTVTIRNGVPIQRRDPRTPGARLMFGTACRISPDKRLDDLLAAFALAHAALPPYELHIAGRIERGADEYAKALREIARALPVVWRGELPGTADFLRELDVFVMISEPAGCPNASLEAMAAGLPVIATDAGGAHEQVIDRVTGRITPARDAAALAVALIELAHHPKAQVYYGMAGQTRAASEFSLEGMVEAYARLCLGEA